MYWVWAQALYRRINYELRIICALGAAGVWRSERKPPPLHYDTGHVTSADTTSDTKSVQKLSWAPFGRRAPDSNWPPFDHSGYTPQLRSQTVLVASQKAASRTTDICCIRCRKYRTNNSPLYCQTALTATTAYKGREGNTHIHGRGSRWYSGQLHVPAVSDTVFTEKKKKRYNPRLVWAWWQPEKKPSLPYPEPRQCNSQPIPLMVNLSRLISIN